MRDVIYLGLRPVYDDPTPEHLLQAYFDPRKSSRGICSGCRGQRIWQWVVLDRLPDMLLLRMSMQHKGKWVDHVLRPVTLLADAVEERDLEDGRPPVWRPGRMQVTYKPVVVGLVRQYKVRSSTGAICDSTHAFAASCLPFIDEEGRWLVYDGMRGIFDDSVSKEVILENSDAELLHDIRHRDYGVGFVIMKKQTEVQIEWEDRYVEPVRPRPTAPLDPNAPAPISID